MIKIQISTVLKFLGIIILLYFLKEISLNSLFESVASIQVFNLLFIIFLVISLVTLKAFRWIIIVKSTTNVHIPFSFSFNSIICGIAGGSIVPGRFDGTKPILLNENYGIEFSKSVSSMIIERFSDISAVIILFLLFILLINSENFDNLLITQIISSFFLLFILMIYFLPDKILNFTNFFLKIFPLPKNLKNSFLEFTDIFFKSVKKISITKYNLQIVFISLITIYLEIFRLQFLFSIFNINLGIFQLGFLFCLTILISILTFIPGSVGVYEASQSELILTYNSLIDKNLVKNIILLDRIFAYYFIVLFGILILFFNDYFFDKKLKR